MDLSKIGDPCCWIAIILAVGNIICWFVIFNSNFYAKYNGKEIIIGETNKLKEVDQELKKDVNNLSKQLSELTEIIKNGNSESKKK